MLANYCHNKNWTTGCSNLADVAVASVASPQLDTIVTCTLAHHEGARRISDENSLANFYPFTCNKHFYSYSYMCVCSVRVSLCVLP